MNEQVTDERDAPSGYSSTDAADQWKRWNLEIKLAEKKTKRWHERAKKILKVYADQADDTSSHKYNYRVFWANVETLKPALYARTPNPQVQRRTQEKEEISRLASELLERSLSFYCDDEVFNPAIRRARDEMLLVGRGQVWLRYTPHFTTIEQPLPVDETGTPILEGVPQDAEIKQNEAGQFYIEQEVLEHEEVTPEYVHYMDFGHTPARTWDEVRAVWRIAYMNRDEAIEFFGEEVAAKIKFNHAGSEVSEALKSDSSIPDSSFKKAKIYEIWSKDDKRVFWYCPDYDRILKAEDDPLGLKDFFPCPKPLFGTLTPNDLTPIPDYAQYQSQAELLEELSKRIRLLTKALKVAGIYDASLKGKGLDRLLSESTENHLIPATDFYHFTQSGGLQKNIQFLPIAEIAGVLTKLVEMREQAKRDLYEISGMSDLVRGYSDPRTTATAEQIKGRFANLRFEEKQRLVQEFCRDVVAIMGEIISEQFSPDTLINIAGQDYLNNERRRQLIMPAIELLQNDVQRRFRIDIETDSTLAVEEDLDRANTNEFLQAFGSYMQQALPVAQAQPMLAPMLIEMLLHAVRKYHAGKNLEQAIEQSLEQVMEAAKQPPPQQQPDPEMLKVQLKQQEMQQDFQIKQQELAMKQAETQKQIELMDARIQAILQQAQSEVYKDQAMGLRAQGMGAPYK